MLILIKKQLLSTIFTFSLVIASYFCLHLKANKQLFGTNQKFNV